MDKTVKSQRLVTILLTDTTVVTASSPVVKIYTISGNCELAVVIFYKNLLRAVEKFVKYDLLKL